MKSKLLLFILLPRLVFGICVPSRDIKPVGDLYHYTGDCHIEVGKEIKKAQERKKIIELKDLAIEVQIKRADKWEKTATDLENKLDKIEELNKEKQWLYFGLGILLMGAATYGAGQLRN